MEWAVHLDEEEGPVVAMEWRVEVEAVVVGRSGGQVISRVLVSCASILEILGVVYYMPVLIDRENMSLQILPKVALKLPILGILPNT